jgi:hypothetical protein
VAVTNVPPLAHGGLNRTGVQGAYSESPVPEDLPCIAIGIYDLKLQAWTEFEKSWCYG